jgi:hypothetical protein
VNWGNLNVSQTPYHFPPIFDGDRVIVYANMDEIPSRETVTLTADTSAGPLSVPVTLEVDKISNGTSLFKLAGKSMIRDLEDKRSYLHAKSPGISQTEVDKEIIRISIR